jgi:hypothetical protein
MSSFAFRAGRAVLGGLAFVLAFGIVPGLAQSTGEVPAELESVRAALEKYQDPFVAVHDGYFSTVACVTVPEPGGEGRVQYQPGGMGIHFLNMSAVTPEIDPARPTVLLYEPDGEKLRLVGAEWFVPLATGVKERPELYGHPFEGPMQGHHPLMPEELAHYDLHVWLFKPNPLGIFSPTNPDVTCEGADYPLAEEAPLIVTPAAGG